MYSFNSGLYNSCYIISWKSNNFQGISSRAKSFFATTKAIKFCFFDVRIKSKGCKKNISVLWTWNKITFWRKISKIFFARNFSDTNNIFASILTIMKGSDHHRKIVVIKISSAINIDYCDANLHLYLLMAIINQLNIRNIIWNRQYRNQFQI